LVFDGDDRFYFGLGRSDDFKSNFVVYLVNNVVEKKTR
jgi:hypothetical protein